MEEHRPGHGKGTADAGHGQGTVDAGHGQGTVDAGHGQGTVDAGFVTLEVVVASALALLVVVVLANLLVVQYARGVLRAAVDEGARAGSRVDAGAEVCEARARAALDDLLGGALGDGVVVRCAVDDDAVVAEADGVLPGWVPPVPDLRVAARALAVREVAP